MNMKNKNCVKRTKLINQSEILIAACIFTFIAVIGSLGFVKNQSKSHTAAMQEAAAKVVEECADALNNLSYDLLIHSLENGTSLSLNNKNSELATPGIDSLKFNTANCFQLTVDWGEAGSKEMDLILTPEVERFSHEDGSESVNISLEYKVESKFAGTTKTQGGIMNFFIAG